MKYKAVIFDFDDTLVESRLAKWEHHKFVAKKFYNILLTDEDIKPHWGKPLNLLIEILYKNSDTLENMYQALLSTKGKFPKLVFKETKNVLEKLLADNIELGLVSATNKRFILDDMTRFSLPYEKFFIIQGSDEVTVHKPDGAVFNQALELLQEKGILKEEIVYIGDSLDDLEASKNAEIYFIGITTGLYSTDDFIKNGAQMVVNNISEIIDHIY